jgi:hypothetical protein
MGTTASKHAEKVPLGLVPNWQTKFSKASRPTLESESKHVSSPLGGLSDDDTPANLERPSAMSTEHKTRKNEVHFLFYVCANNC